VPLTAPDWCRICKTPPFNGILCRYCPPAWREPAD